MHSECIVVLDRFFDCSKLGLDVCVYEATLKVQIVNIGVPIRIYIVSNLHCI